MTLLSRAAFVVIHDEKEKQKENIVCGSFSTFVHDIMYRLYTTVHRCLDSECMFQWMTDDDNLSVTSAIDCLEILVYVTCRA